MSLIAWYKLDGNANDSVKNNDGTSSNVSWIDGKIGTCGEFSKSLESDIDTNSTIFEKNPFSFTVSCWFMNTDTFTDWTYIVIHSVNGSLGGSSFAIIFDNNGDLVLTIDGDYTSYNTNITSSDLQNKWTHTLFTYNDGNIKFYVNNTKELDFTHKITSNPILSNDFWIGGGYSGRSFTGKVDDVKLYNHTLSTKEVKELYKSKVLHYKMDETIISGLIYEWYDTQTWYDNNSHPTTESEMDEFFDDSNSGVSFGGDGLFEKEIYWGSSGQTGPDGTVDDKPSYLPTDYYSWKVKGFIYAPETGTYTIGVDSDDASDVIIDGQLTANYYNGHGFNGTWTGGTDQNTGTIDLVSGNYYSFVARMEEAGGGDGIAVGWQKPSDSSVSTIPSRYFYYRPINDSSGYNNHGTNNGATFTTDSKIGSGCYEFDGVDDEILISDANPFKFGTGDFTISLWATPNSITSYQTLYEIGKYTDGILFRPTDSSIQLHISGSSFSASHTRSIGRWDHYIVKRESGVASIIVNNGLLNSSTLDGSIDMTTTTYSKIGSSTHIDSQRWDGKIDDVRIYSTALTQSDIEELYYQRASLDSDGNFYNVGGLVEGDNALSFDGVDDYVDLGSSFIPDSNFTFECWVKTDPSNSNGDVFRQFNPGIILYSYSDYGSANGNLRVYTSNKGEILVGSDIRGTGWRHVALVRDGSGMTLYVDGVSDATGTVDGYDDTSDCTLSSPSSSFPFDGDMSDVRKWDHARTQTELQDNMNKRLNGDEIGLVAYYKLDEGTGTTATDSAGTNDGTIYGATWSRGIGLSNSFSIENNGNITKTNFSETGPVKNLINWWSLDGHAKDISPNRNDGKWIDYLSEQTSSSLGWTGGSGYNNTQGETDPCSGLVTFEEALQHAHDNGARLPTVDELQNDATKGTGCGYDSQMCWTCDSGNTDNYHWVVEGRAGSLGIGPYLKSNNDTAYVRMVADDDLSRSDPVLLGDIVIYNWLYNYRGSYPPSPDITSGLEQMCYSFTGSNYEYVESNSTITIPQICTISCWINGNVTNQISESIYPVGFDNSICLLGPSGGTDSRAGIIGRKDSTNYYWDWNGQNIFNGEWHHYVVSWDNTYVYLFVDGVQIGSGKSINGNLPIGESVNFYIGSAWGPSTYGAFTGKIQDVRLYNTILSAKDIHVLYSLTGGSDINKMKQTQNNLYVKSQFKEY